MTLRLPVFVVVLLFSILIFGIANAQPAPSETPATRVFHAWLAAFNSGDEAKFKAFDDTYKPERPMAKMAGFRQQTGGFTLVRVEKEEATSFTGIVKEKASDNLARIVFAVTADDPPKMLSVELRLVPPQSTQISAPSSAPTPAPRPAPARLPEADALAAVATHMDAAVRKDTFSGAILIAKNGKVLLQKAGGRADREKGIPVSLDTQFRIASMNKMFTAVAILQLVEAGKLSLDDTIGKHLTDYPNSDVANKVTIRHLLTHTSGLGDPFGPDFEPAVLTFKSHTDFVKHFGARPARQAPGVTWSYSSLGYILLGVLIEKMSGQSYYDYVEKFVFSPQA